MKTFLVLLLLGILAALVIIEPFFEVADNTLLQNGVTGFDGEPPPCRADRVGLVLTLKGKPSVCQATRNGYQWVPTQAAPARVQPAAPRPTPARWDCGSPPGLLGETMKGMYTDAAGRNLDARCGPNGWEAIR